MKILAIESSALTASVAIYEDGVITAEYSTNFKKTHSQTLMPMIAQVVSMTETDLESLLAIAVSGGPGSFTGLRIGSATAKGLALALEKPIIHVPTLDAMAYNLYGSRDLIVPIMDARRSQVYTGLYTFEGENLKILKESCAMDINELLELIGSEYIGKGFERAIFLGDGVKAFKSVIDEKASSYRTYPSAANVYQRAASLAALAAVYYEEGKLTDPDLEAPVYLRPSQAERVRAEKESQG